MTWLVMGVACGGYLVPYAAATGFEARVAYSSTGVFCVAVAAGLLAVGNGGRKRP